MRPATWLAFVFVMTCAWLHAAADFKIGPDVLLDSAAVSAGNAQYLVVWRDISGAAPQIRGVTVSAGGIVGTPFAISNTIGRPLEGAVQRPTVAFDGTNYLVVWADNRGGAAGVHAAFITSAGAVLNNNDFFISPISRTNDIAPQVVFTGADYLVSWQDTAGSAGGTQIFFARVSTAAVVGTRSSLPFTGTPNQSLEFLVRGPANEVLLVYQDLASVPNITRGTRIAPDNSFPGGGEGVLLFRRDFGTLGFGAPIGAAFDGTEYLILGSHGAQIDSSVFKIRLPPGGAVQRPSAPFAEVGQGTTGLPEDNFPRTFYNGAKEFLFLRNSKVSETAYHILAKRVTSDDIDKDPNVPLIDLASRGVLNGAVAASIGAQYLVIWMDGRRIDLQPAKQANIFGAFLDSNAVGDTTQPFLKAVARARPIIGNSPLTVSFSTGGSAGIIDVLRWDFGDGKSSQFGTTTNKYETRGDFTAVLSLFRAGFAVRDFVRILVDTDALGGGGGPPEAIGGSLGPVSDGVNSDILISNVIVTLNFAAPKLDQLRVTGFFDPTVLPVATLDKKATVTIAGRTHNFTLNATGTAASEIGATPVQRFFLNTFTGQFQFTTTLDELQTLFAPLGLTNDTNTKPGVERIIPLTVSLGDVKFDSTVSGFYISQTGKTGTFRYTFGSLGNQGAGYMHIFGAKAAETGKTADKTHSFTVTGNMGLGGTQRVLKAETGVWRVKLGDYSEDIPVSSLATSGDLYGFKAAQKSKVGINQFIYNTRTGFFGVFYKLVPATGDKPSGMPLATSPFARVDMALSFELDTDTGKKFQASAFMRLVRPKQNTGKWRIR